MHYELNLSWIQNIGSGSIRRVNIIGVTTRNTEVGIKEGEIDQGLWVIVGVPSLVDQLLRRWTTDNVTGGLPINEETAHILAIT